MSINRRQHRQKGILGRTAAKLFNLKMQLSLAL